MDSKRGWGAALAAALALAICGGCNGTTGPGAKPAEEKAAGSEAPAAPKGEQPAPGEGAGDAVAVVNGVAIGETKFALTLRDAAFGAKSATIEGRRHVLDLLIGQELKRQEALARGLDRSPAVQRAEERVRREDILRQVKRKLAADALMLDEKEIEQGLGPLPQIIEASLVLVADKGEADDLVRRIRAGEDMGALAATKSEAPGAGKGPRRATFYTRAGTTMYPTDVENALFAMGPGEVAALATPVGYLIARVESRRDLSAEEVAQARTNVRNKLIEEKLTRTQEQILEARRKEFPVKRLLERFSDQPAPADDPLVTWRTFDATPLATVGPLTLTLGDMYRGLDDYRLVKASSKDVWDNAFSQGSEAAIAKALYYFEGARLGFKQSEAAEKEIAEWRKDMAAQAYESEIALAVKRESLGPEQCGGLFEKNRKRYLRDERLNVSQILVRREEQARAVAARLRAGEEFAKVAREVSLDPSAQKGGDLGRLRRSQLIELFSEQGARDIIGQAEARVTDPVTLRTTKGYHVMLLSGYQRAGEGTFAEVGEELFDECLAAQRRLAVEKATAELRAKARISIDEKRLAAVVPAPGTPADGVHKGGGSGPAPGMSHGGSHGGGGFPGAGGGLPHGGGIPPAKP